MGCILIYINLCVNLYRDFIIFYSILSNFGTCNKIIILVMFKLWRVEKYFEFSRLGIIKLCHLIFISYLFIYFS